VRRSERSREALGEVREHTISVIDAIRAEKRFDPKPSPLCGWCEYAALCPASLTHRRAVKEVPANAGSEAPIEIPAAAVSVPAVVPAIAEAAALPRATSRRRRARPIADGQLSLV
jgi:hypothetical protein